MRIGIDFDNTIICYDGIFHKVALERKLIDENFPKSKSKIRNHLRERDIEDEWTDMQGYVYGKRIVEAEPFPGILDFFIFCRKQNLTINIISHKTRFPYLGHQYDLHDAAYTWLSIQGFFDPEVVGLARESVFFELTKQAKIDRVKKLQCTHFIDDLPEFLSEESFPEHVQRFVFDPDDNHVSGCSFPRITSWEQAFEAMQ